MCSVLPLSPLPVTVKGTEDATAIYVDRVSASPKPIRASGLFAGSVAPSSRLPLHPQPRREWLGRAEQDLGDSRTCKGLGVGAGGKRPRERHPVFQLTVKNPELS